MKKNIYIEKVEKENLILITNEDGDVYEYFDLNYIKGAKENIIAFFNICHKYQEQGYNIKFIARFEN